uniref:Myocyte enhancer factor 2d n=1 Tax=Petromyzon marinus TaxID=7757 RepID=S4RGR4_PETMA
AKSPPPPSQGQAGNKPDLRVVIPSNSKGMMPTLSEQWRLLLHLDVRTSDWNSSQVTQSLATPVVSVATPSIPPQALSGYPSAMPTAYNTDYSLAELTALTGLNSPGTLHLGSVTWQQQQLHNIPQSMLNQLLPCDHFRYLQERGGLTVNTNMSVSVKSEPVSPPKGGVVSSAMFRATSRSPGPGATGDSLSSSGSSYDGGSDREDLRNAPRGGVGMLRSSPDPGDAQAAKRLRIDGWPP